MAPRVRLPENVTGFKKVMANPYVATVITVVLGILLGLNGYQKIWALFGSANQLLAALALLAVATWLGNVGKNNKMFLIPMAFMLVVTICSLIINTKTQIGLITKGGADWGSLCSGDPRRAAGHPGPSSSRSRVSPPSASRPRPRLRSKLGFQLNQGGVLPVSADRDRAAERQPCFICKIKKEIEAAGFDLPFFCAVSTSRLRGFPPQ